MVQLLTLSFLEVLLEMLLESEATEKVSAKRHRLQSLHKEADYTFDFLESFTSNAFRNDLYDYPSTLVLFLELPSSTLRHRLPCLLTSENPVWHDERKLSSSKRMLLMSFHFSFKLFLCVRRRGLEVTSHSHSKDFTSDFDITKTKRQRHRQQSSVKEAPSKMD